MTTARAEPLRAIPTPRFRARAGVGPGLVGGGAMAAVLVVAALDAGAPVLVAFQAIGAVLPGVPDGSPAAAVVGVLAHAAVSAALGAIFAALVPLDFPPPCAAGVGVGYALLVMSVAVALFLPTSFVRDIHAIGGSWVIAHAVFGATLGLALRRPTRGAAGADR